MDAHSQKQEVGPVCCWQVSSSALGLLIWPVSRVGGPAACPAKQRVSGLLSLLPQPAASSRHTLTALQKVLYISLLFTHLASCLTWQQASHHRPNVCSPLPPATPGVECLGTSDFGDGTEHQRDIRYEPTGSLLLVTFLTPWPTWFWVCLSRLEDTCQTERLGWLSLSGSPSCRSSCSQEGSTPGLQGWCTGSLGTQRIQLSDISIHLRIFFIPESYFLCLENVLKAGLEKNRDLTEAWEGKWVCYWDQLRLTDNSWWKAVLRRMLRPSLGSGGKQAVIG